MAGRFKEGDKVVVVDGSGSELRGFMWVDNMQYLVGKTLTINECFHDNSYGVEGNDYGWASEWLRLADESGDKPQLTGFTQAMQLTAKNLLQQAKPVVTFELNEQITQFLEQLEA